MRKPIRVALVVGASAALLGAPAGVLASGAGKKPAANKHWQLNRTKKRSLGDFETSKDSKLVKSFKAYTKCANPPVFLPKLRVRNGKVHFRGTRKSAVGTKVKVVMSMTFVKRTLGKGTIRQTTSKCKDSSHRFRATVTGPATGT